MLYWICPECGRECSPAIRECPTCTAPPAVQEPIQQPVRQRTSASWELLALAENFQSRASVALLTAPPVEPELSQKLAALDNLAVKPARPARSEPVKVIAAPVPVGLSSPPVLPAAAPTRAEFGLVPAGPTPVGEISFQAARAKSSFIEQPAEPLPSRRQSVAFVRAELHGADRGGMAIADLAQLVAQPYSAPLKPAVPHRNGQPKDIVSTPLAYKSLPYKSNEPSVVSSRLKVTGESLAELLNALKISAEERDRAAIQAIQASFCEKPAVWLLSAPAEIVTAPAPPAGQWLRSEKPEFTAAAPENTGHTVGVAGPQTPTLAGPSLPPQLLNLDLRNSSLRPHRRASSWLISLLVATIVILGAVALLQHAMQNRDTTVASIAAPVRAIKAAASPLGVVEEHPAARSVEVAGVRIVAGSNKKPQLEYIVINHSSMELTGLNIRIAIRSVEALADAPLFSVSNVVATLAPNQSKEIRTDLDSSIQSSAIPDWQSLRTEVLIARQ
jgi:hypothetical protein